MSHRPDAPDGLPKYLREGIPKQSNENLRAVQEWIDELLEYQQDNFTRRYRGRRGDALAPPRSVRPPASTQCSNSGVWMQPLVRGKN